MGILRKIFKPMFQRDKWKILRGDTVMITVGKDRGQIGTVLKVIRDEKFPRVIVEGLNLSKRSIKRTKDNPGGIVSVESPIHYSNVSLIDPVTNASVKVGWRYLEDGTKVRITRGKLASASVISRPEILKQRRKPRPIEAGPKDTTLSAAKEETHVFGDLPTALKNMLQSSKVVDDATDILPKFVQGRKGALYQSPSPSQRLQRRMSRSPHQSAYSTFASSQFTTHI